MKTGVILPGIPGSTLEPGQPRPLTSRLLSCQAPPTTVTGALSSQARGRVLRGGPSTQGCSRGPVAEALMETHFTTALQTCTGPVRTVQMD